MSGIGALFNLDGQPADPDMMTHMLDLIRHRGPDARGVWHSGGVALGQVMLHSTPESRRERQPLAAPDGLCVAFDGFLDSRLELTRELAGTHGRAPLDTDAELLMAAYRQWGDGCFGRLLGDFAALVWDPSRRRLVCARDILGLRPLYYYYDRRRFVCGSEPQQLIAGAAIPAEPNEGMIAEYLALRITSREETLCRNVLRLPAAHLLSVDANGLEKRRYYDLDPSAEVRYARDDDYSDRFRELFSGAITRRLRSDTPIAAYLSGGLDSSSVVCLTEDMRRRTAVPDFPFLTLSMIAPGVPDDESGYVKEVVDTWGVESHVTLAATPDPDVFADQVKRYRDFPAYPNVMAAAGLLDTARARGCKVVLTGIGGDDWLCANYSHAADLLRHGRIREFVAQLPPRDGLGAWPFLKATLMTGIWPLLSDAVQAAVVAARRRAAWPDYLTQEFVRATDLEHRVRRPRRPLRCSTRTQQELYDWFDSGDLAYANEADERHHQWFGLEARHPFHDRRVMEFLLAIPEEQRWRSTTNKFILRQALGDVLPPHVRSRTTKGDYAHTVPIAFDACGGEQCFTSMELARRGWVREEQVLALYRDMRTAFARNDPTYATQGVRLWTLYGIELVLRHGFN